MTDWTYYTWDAQHCELVDDDGGRICGADGKPMQFASADAAEQYLVDNDIRGTVR